MQRRAALVPHRSSGPVNGRQRELVHGQRRVAASFALTSKIAAVQCRSTTSSFVREGADPPTRADELADPLVASTALNAIPIDFKQQPEGR